MLPKTPSARVRAAVFSPILIGSFLALAPADRGFAQAPPPPAPVAPATLNRLFNEAEKAFVDKQYDTAVAKIQELLKALGPSPNKDLPLEQLYFNIGLAHLLANQLPEAEAAFADTLKRYPNGEYRSRAFLGAGRA